jgi:hypothetical protein
MSWGRVNLEAEQTMLNGKRQRDTDDVGFGNGGFPIQAMSNGGAVRLGMKRMKSSFVSPLDQMFEVRFPVLAEKRSIFLLSGLYVSTYPPTPSANP